MTASETLIRNMSAEYQEYLRDESRSQGQAQTISFPQNKDQVMAVLKRLHPQKTPITLQGGRTGLSAGAVPQGGHILNLTHMNRVVGFGQNPEGYFTVRAEPGLVLLNLRKMLESKKFDTAPFDENSLAAYSRFLAAPEQFFPTDPTESTATIGGIVACNASGARSYLYGPARPYIEGLELVLADGQTLHISRGQTKACGRRLALTTDQGNTLHIKLPEYMMPATKNASGYFIEEDMDAIDLFIGSDGTLGVITEIELKLLPLPQVIWGVSCFFTAEEQAQNFVIAARQKLHRLASMEFFDTGALTVLRRQKQQNTAFAQLPEVAEDFVCAVYVELHYEDEQQATACLFAIGDLLSQAGANPQHTWVARTAADRDRLLFFRHAVPEAVNMLIDARKKTNPSLTKLGTDMSVPDCHLPFIMAMYRRMLEERGLESAIWGHIGNNHLHVNILPRDSEDYRQGKELYLEWARIVSAHGGAVSAEHGVGKLKADFLTIMYGQENVAAMAAAKAALDPQAQLGVGNLFPLELVKAAAQQLHQKHQGGAAL